MIISAKGLFSSSSWCISRKMISLSLRVLLERFSVNFWALFGERKFWNTFHLVIIFSYFTIFFEKRKLNEDKTAVQYFISSLHPSSAESEDLSWIQWLAVLPLWRWLSYENSTFSFAAIFNILCHIFLPLYLMLIYHKKPKLFKRSWSE